MSWIARAAGVGIGAVLGGAEGAKLGYEIGDIVGKALASEPRQPLAARMLARADDLGTALEFRIEASVPRGALAFIDVLNDIGDPLATRDALFSDTQGQFLSAVEIHDQSGDAYVPYGVLEYRRAGMYSVRLRCMWFDEACNDIDELGQARFQVLLPSPFRAWSRVELVRPLIWLAMKVVRADGHVARSEVRRLVRKVSGEFELGPDDLPALRAAMLEQPSVSIAEMVSMLGLRFPGMDTEALLSMLAECAWADGFLDDREVAVIREVAVCLGLTKEEWRHVVRTCKLQG